MQWLLQVYDSLLCFLFTKLKDMGCDMCCGVTVVGESIAQKKSSPMTLRGNAMWVQQLNKIGIISLNTLGKLENVADLLTKHVPRAVLDKLAGMMGYTFPDEETQKFQEYTSINQNSLGSEMGSN